MHSICKVTSLVLFLAFVVCPEAVSADADYYFWNYQQHPYQNYYLEDYCGPSDTTDCRTESHVIHINSTGSGSALIIRGFRKSTPALNYSLKCCITVRTFNLSRFNVQLDEIYMKQKKLGQRCENFLRFHGLEEELGFVCGEIDRHSFRTPKNVLDIEYVLNSSNAPEYQKIKVVVTSTVNPNTLNGATCDAKKEQWMCDNGSCIWDGFRCDAHNNCGDWSDEFYCGFFSRNWPIFAGVACGIFLLCLGCCCYCCCCKNRRKTIYIKGGKGFQFVSSLGPNSQPVPTSSQGAKIYPTLEVPYQRSGYVTVTSNVQPGAPPHQSPPPYTEVDHITPARNPNYGATTATKN